MQNLQALAILASTSLLSAFRSRASWVAFDIGLFKPLVLSTIAELTIALESHPTVPVNVGLIIGGFKFRAFCVAVDIGLFKSLVLSTLAKSTISLESPPTVPVNVGLLGGALVAIRFVKEVEKFSSLFNACANSFKVSSVAGEEATRLAILASTSLSAFRFSAFCVACDIALNH